MTRDQFREVRSKFIGLTSEVILKETDKEEKLEIIYKCDQLLPVYIPDTEGGELESVLISMRMGKAKYEKLPILIGVPLLAPEFEGLAASGDELRTYIIRLKTEIELYKHECRRLQKMVSDVLWDKEHDVNLHDLD